MSVRAKFRCNSVKRQIMSGKEVHTIELSPVYGGAAASEENQQFFTATPSGRIELGCVNPAAVGQFEPEGEYYVTFEPAGEEKR